MPIPINPRGEDNQTSYMVQDTTNSVEMLRLALQDRFITQGMGGPLSEHPDPASLHQVLDVGCGTGGWLLELAATFPHMELVGIDASWTMIEYAQEQASSRHLINATFRLMDALRPLDFRNHSFDLINLRLASGFMRLPNWPVLLQEFVRVSRPGGIIRLVDAQMPTSNSPAYNRLNELFLCAGYRDGHIPELDKRGIVPYLGQFLRASGCQNVQETIHSLEYRAGTVAGESFRQDIMYLFQTLIPFLQKTGCVTEDYDALYQEAMSEMQQRDFCAEWIFVTAWGTTPARGSVSK